jgi:chromosome partitioning protein
MELPPNEGIPNFVARAQIGVESAASSDRFADTRKKRVQRRYSMREVSEITGFSRSAIAGWLDQEDAPVGVIKGRENTFSLYDITKLRALAASRPKVPGAKGRKQTLFWRKPDDPIPVITFSSQKGGVAKSLTAAGIAQFAALYHGLRVGLIDCDAQATLSLYFADETIDVAGTDVDTFTRFMGVPTPGDPPLVHTDKELDDFWVKTPWPGVRLIPGGAPIQEADISMYFMAQKTETKRVYRLLKDALDRWTSAYPAKTRPEDLRDENGVFLEDKFNEALNETFDVIIVDCAPALTLTQLNAVVAASTLIVPNTLRGFDLSTLKVYLSSLDDYLQFIRHEDDPVDFPPVPSYILPTNVQVNNDMDISQVGELYGHDPEVICPVYSGHSAAVANASRDYLSIYEYEPEKSRKRSADQFLANANAVGDAILSRAVPWIEPRGYANEFISERYGGIVPPWTLEPGSDEGQDEDSSVEEGV